MRGTMKSLSTVHEKDKAELYELKIQMVYQKNIVKNAEVESTVLRKRLREMEESCRWERMLRKSLTA